MRGWIVAAIVAAASAHAEAQQIDFTRQVLPVFEANCACHGGQNNLFLDSYAHVMAGTSFNGPVVLPGNGEGSLLVKKLRGTAPFGGRMPPGGPFLPDSTIDMISLWITQGARATPTGVSGVFRSLPVGTELRPNYPNPFNPATTVTFRLGTAGPVRLVVLDLSGRQVADLVNGPMPAGTHRVRFDASDLASGVYFVRLTSAGTSLTRKMLLER